METSTKKQIKIFIKETQKTLYYAEQNVISFKKDVEDSKKQHEDDLKRVKIAEDRIKAKKQIIQILEREIKE